MPAHARRTAPAAAPPHLPPSANGHDPDSPRPDALDAATGGGGRDAKGRFAKGNKGGPGNPFARQVAALRRALLDVVTEEDMEAIAQELVRQAREGSLAAMKLLFSYTLGRPAEVVDPDTLDLEEWQQYKQGAQAGPELAGMLHAMPVGLACHVQRAARPGVAELYRNGLLDGLQAAEATDTEDGQQDAGAVQEDGEADAPGQESEEAPGAGEGPAAPARREGGEGQPAFPARPELGLPQGLTEAEWLASLGLPPGTGGREAMNPGGGRGAGRGRVARPSTNGANGRTGPGR